MGSLYRKHRRQPDGTTREERVWWAKYYVNGRPVRESTGTDQVKRAERFLKAREGAVATGQPILPRADRVRYEEAAAAHRGAGSRGSRVAVRAPGSLLRSVAIKITGHRTEAVYRRYAIVSDADLRAATHRLAGTIPGTAAVTNVDA